jgi:hypothetical protein
MSNRQNEAFSRVLIDKALEFSGWNLLSSHDVRFEQNGNSGRADYVLMRPNKGTALCVLEAKREDVDPYDAKEQARGYAENLKAPFVILSNGKEHWFWNYTRPDQDAYRIERLPSQKDLERLLLKNLQPPRPLMSEVITPEYLTRFKHDFRLPTTRESVGVNGRILDGMNSPLNQNKFQNIWRTFVLIKRGCYYWPCANVIGLDLSSSLSGAEGCEFNPRRAHQSLLGFSSGCSMKFVFP